MGQSPCSGSLDLPVRVGAEGFGFSGAAGMMVPVPSIKGSGWPARAAVGFQEQSRVLFGHFPWQQHS